MLRSEEMIVLLSTVAGAKYSCGCEIDLSVYEIYKYAIVSEDS